MSDDTVHTMEAAYQQSGHLLLHCPICGYRVQIDPRTLKRKTLEDGGKFRYKHAWVLDGGLNLGVTGSKKPSSVQCDDMPERKPRKKRPTFTA